jgi:energy-coupling factor transporter ATP-binding protein EcfA2
MSWRGEEGGILAAKAKHQVIMTPGSHCYFDHYQSTYAKEPLAIGSYLPLERVYSYNPIPTVLTKQQSSYILGAQGNVWTEYMSDENKVFYMAYPRAIALAEVNWTEEKNKSYSDFIKRLHHHSKWFKENNISFSLSYLDLNYKTLNNNNHVELIINKPALDGSILLETIKEIEETATANFLMAFNQVRVHFQDVFRSLFTSDDDCDLILLDENDPLECDIDIVAKPKGKRPKSIHQLSGGEKTLTAIALLFSLYLLKPAPFCIFDEVDAPLDDINIEKFNTIIRKFSSDSQFIIITHNKLTMAEVDVLYGVYMEQQGISNVAAVDFRKYEHDVVLSGMEN